MTTCLPSTGPDRCFHAPAAREAVQGARIAAHEYAAELFEQPRIGFRERAGIGAGPGSGQNSAL
jgi:hypothetical protein